MTYYVTQKHPSYSDDVWWTILHVQRCELFTFITCKSQWWTCDWSSFSSFVLVYVSLVTLNWKTLQKNMPWRHFAQSLPIVSTSINRNISHISFRQWSIVLNFFQANDYDLLYDYFWKNACSDQIVRTLLGSLCHREILWGNICLDHFGCSLLCATPLRYFVN